MSDLGPGSRLGVFDVGNLVGEGGTGTVYRTDGNPFLFITDAPEGVRIADGPRLHVVLYWATGLTKQ